MNTTPHSHKLEWHGEQSYAVLNYGDQQYFYSYMIPFKWYKARKIKRAYVRLIRKHDKASLKAGQKNWASEPYWEIANQVTDTARWGSDQLK